MNQKLVRKQPQKRSTSTQLNKASRNLNAARLKLFACSKHLSLLALQLQKRGCSLLRDERMQTFCERVNIHQLTPPPPVLCLNQPLSSLRNPPTELPADSKALTILADFLLLSPV